MPYIIVGKENSGDIQLYYAALLASKIVKNSKLKIYPGGTHGLTVTQKNEINADLLAFLKE